jgi:hypothetical protein
MKHHATSQEEHTIPKISGQIKVAVSIRMLAGGSYLDLVPLFQISTSHLYQVLDDFLHWVLKTFQCCFAMCANPKIFANCSSSCIAVPNPSMSPSSLNVFVPVLVAIVSGCSLTLMFVAKLGLATVAAIVEPVSNIHSSLKWSYLSHVCLLTNPGL